METLDRLSNLSTDKLKAKLEWLKDNLCDFKEMHAFSCHNPAIHIGAEKALDKQTEFEKQCRKYTERIAAIEKELEARGVR